MAIKSVTSSHFPYLSLLLQVRHREEKMEVLLDTGFDGDIAIPKGMLTNGDIPNGLLPWSLADGSKIIAPAYIGKVRIGQGIIKHFNITLDHGKRIILEK